LTNTEKLKEQVHSPSRLVFVVVLRGPERPGTPLLFPFLSLCKDVLQRGNFSVGGSFLFLILLALDLLQEKRTEAKGGEEP
jgi:hypothetical protein